MELYSNWFARGTYFLVFFLKALFTWLLLCLQFFMQVQHINITDYLLIQTMKKLLLKCALWRACVYCNPIQKVSFWVFCCIIKFGSLTVFPCTRFTLELFLIKIKLHGTKVSLVLLMSRSSDKCELFFTDVLRHSTCLVAGCVTCLM